MNRLFVLAQATTLPPPPSPQANHSVSPLSILIVVAIVLGSVAMIALSSRRLRRPASAHVETPPIEAAAEIPEPLEAAAPPDPAPYEEADAPDHAPDDEVEARVDPNLIARLRRVTGVKPAERRKLGHRKPTDVHEPQFAPQVAGRRSMETQAALTDDGQTDDLESAPNYPEPIPIRRRASQQWQDEPDFAPGPLSGRAARTWSGGGAIAMPGLTSDELAQLESPRIVARAAHPLPRLRSDAPIARPEAAPNADGQLLEELSVTVRELLFCANVGEVLRGFSLYSDAFLFRTMDDSGLDEDEFRATFDGQPAKPVRDWTRLAEIRDLDRLAPDLVAATVVYISSAGVGETAPERFRFLRNPDGQNWLIDDISSAEIVD